MKKIDEILLTRAEYDDIITKEVGWVQNNWHKLSKRWSLAGVRVRGDGKVMAELDHILYLTRSSR